jgi:glutamine cyclotransferase
MRPRKKSRFVCLLLPALTVSAAILFFAQKISKATDIASQPTSYSDFLSKLIHADLTTTPVYGYRVVKAYPHDPNAFTQGLVFDKGLLYESTGLRGRSSVRQVEMETGKIQNVTHLPSRYFGEGLTLWQEKLIQLTWQSGVGFIYDKRSLHKLGGFKYHSEGWGITQNKAFFIVSDGTPTLRFWDPETFAEVKRIKVHHHGVAISYLNELEFIEGEIYANVWKTDYIARISPETGEVVGWIDLKNLLSPAGSAARLDVLNGIAYDPLQDRLFVTGKLWPKLFEIELTPKTGETQLTD